MTHLPSSSSFFLFLSLLKVCAAPTPKSPLRHSDVSSVARDMSDVALAQGASSTDVAALLESRGLGEYGKYIIEEDIDGDTFIGLSEEDVNGMSTKECDQREILVLIYHLRGSNPVSL